MNRVLFCIIIVLAGVFVNSCAKKEDAGERYYWRNRLIPVESESKTRMYLMSYTVGHTASDCGGRCITVHGKDYHFDCMGYGNVCTHVTTVSMEHVGDSYTATTTDTFGLTSENLYLMPDRSLNYIDETNNRFFLNIPEQLVWRDSTTLQFTFTGLSFSNTPLYPNN